MKNTVLVVVSSLLCISCKLNAPNDEVSEAQTNKSSTETMVGHWDNFQQHWLENTATAMHRTETNDKHRHLSLHISKSENGQLTAKISEGRNGRKSVETIAIPDDFLNQDTITISGDTLYMTGMNHFKNKKPYKFIRTRKFSGWIELPMRQYPDSIYRKSNLEIHDQGGMAEIDVEGVQFTAELTQLLFGHKLAIMKLAIYDMPIDSVEINSRSISYTWLNPEAKRTGINLRKVTSGWTLIEPGFVNSDNTKFDKK